MRRSMIYAFYGLAILATKLDLRVQFQAIAI
jgi:hypothetical protein